MLIIVYNEFKGKLILVPKEGNMISQLLIIFIVTLSILFVKYLCYAIKGQKCVNIKVFLKEGISDKFNELIEPIYKEYERGVKELRDDTLVISILTHMLFIFASSFPVIALFLYNDSLSFGFKTVIIIISIILFLIGNV